MFRFLFSVIFFFFNIFANSSHLDGVLCVYKCNDKKKKKVYKLES